MCFSGVIFLVFGDSRQQDFARDTPSKIQRLEMAEANGLLNNKNKDIELNGTNNRKLKAEQNENYTRRKDMK